MWLSFLTAALSAIAAMFNYLTKSIVGLAMTIYKDKFSPTAKQIKKVKQQAEEAIKSGDRSEITAAFARLNRLRNSKIIVILLLFTLCGCQWFSPNKPAPIILYPISQLDYIPLEAGQELKWTDINNVTHKGAPTKGCFISEFYRDTVMQVLIEEAEK